MQFINQASGELPVFQDASPEPASPHNPEKPWKALPELPPAAGMESREILKACISARAGLARVNALVEVLPNKDNLLPAIPLQEARSSSGTENIVTPGDALHQALAGGGNVSNFYSSGRVAKSASWKKAREAPG